jgi:hypothetical protein
MTRRSGTPDSDPSAWSRVLDLDGLFVVFEDAVVKFKTRNKARSRADSKLTIVPFLRLGTRPVTLRRFGGICQTLTRDAPAISSHHLL